MPTMSWAGSMGWWVAAGVLVAVELGIGTFYLLMLALGCVAGALAAMAGLAPTLQIAAAALVGSGATALWHFKRARSPRSAHFRSNRDVNMDIGERICIRAWDKARSSRVDYRGSVWTAQYDGPGAPGPGEHVIVAIEGNRLIVAPAPR